MSEIKNKLYMSFNSLKKTDNPSQVEATFVVHDWLTSWNNGCITKEICQENMQFLIGQYICCGYVSKEDNDGEDALLDHMVTTEINRDTGEKMVATKTTPIGHITETWVGEGKNSKGEDDEVLYCKATLWLNKFYNIISFIDEMLSNGINVPCSVEYSFRNYNMIDNVMYVQSPIYYEALTVLNPIDRGQIEQVYPAYDSACIVGYDKKFNQAIKADIKSNDESEFNNINQEIKDGDKVEQEIKDEVIKVETQEEAVETPETIEDAVESEKVVDPTPEVDEVTEPVEESQKSLNDKSLIDKQYEKVEAIKSKIVSKINVSSDYVYLSTWNIYTDYVVYETYDNETDEYKYFKQSYSTDVEGEITLGDDRIEVKREEIWVEVKSFNELIEQKNTLETELATSKENEVTLNARIIELQEIETKYNELVFNEKLHEVEEEYKAKFEKVGLNEKFETEEVKGLLVDVAKSMNEAKIKLADMILDAIQGEKAEIKPVMESMNSINKGKALIPTKSKFVENYGFEA